MADASGPLSAQILDSLAALAPCSHAVIHRLQVGLARLVLSQAPGSASGQLDLALAFIEGRANAEDLRDARQDCWTYVGSLACGCSVADSASAHAVMSCLETDPHAHTMPALAEQVEKVLRCGASEQVVLLTLRV